MERTPGLSGWTPRSLSGTNVARDEVHVWQVSIDLPPTTMQLMAQHLSRDERARAARMKRRTDRDRWIANRSALRLLAAHYLETDPGLIEFSYGTHGKPFITFPSTQLQFNASKSAGLALYAFILEHDVGVDLEQVHHTFDSLQVARRLFTPAENTMLRALPPRYRQRVFLHCWTMKEAYLKARGLGQYAGLNPLQVGFAARNEVRVIADDRAVAPRDWSVIPLDVTSRHVGAVAVKTPHVLVRTWQWTPPPPEAPAIPYANRFHETRRLEPLIAF